MPGVAHASPFAQVRAALWANLPVSCKVHVAFESHCCSHVACLWGLGACCPGTKNWTLSQPIDPEAPHIKTGLRTVRTVSTCFQMCINQKSLTHIFFHHINVLSAS